MRITRTRGRTAAIAALTAMIVFCAFASRSRAAAEATVGNAIALYEDARYADALGVLNELATSSATGAARVQIAEYQALCLLALDRTDEARAVVRQLVERRPEYRPESRRFPPRFIAMVQEARAAVLPGVVRTEYRLGKTRYDEESYAVAETHFRNVVRLLEDQSLAPAIRDSLADLRELSEGFLALIPVPPLPPVAAVGGERPSPTPTYSAPPPPAFYTAADVGVRPPIAVRQDMPPWRSAFEDRRRQPSAGTLELIVDESGHVASATLASGVDPVYDVRLLNAARKWEYKPATRDGRPVKYQKIIVVRVNQPSTSRVP